MFFVYFGVDELFGVGEVVLVYDVVVGVEGGGECGVVFVGGVVGEQYEVGEDVQGGDVVYGVGFLEKGLGIVLYDVGWVSLQYCLGLCVVFGDEVC